MRSYLAMELIGTLWLAAAIIAQSEDLTRVWATCVTVALFYYIRAVLKYYTKKETSNAPKAFSGLRAGAPAERLRHDGSSRQPGRTNVIG